MNSKQVFWLFSMFIFANTLCFGQNVQVHYDFGEDRDFVTTTLEMFKPDPLGATFWFVDMDYDSKNNSNSLSYWEIARYFNLPMLHEKLSASVQYNDGVALFGPLHSVWLAGVTYAFDFGFITLNTELLYRYMDVSESPDFQLTFVWVEYYLQEKIQFAGYFDYYTQDNAFGKKLNIIQAEPQLWYVLNDHFYIGGEVEVSRNFIPQFDDNLMFMPTLAVKWIF